MSGRTDIDRRTQNILSEFTTFMKTNVTREKYTYVGIKPNTKMFHIITTSPEYCAELREQIGYFFRGYELKYMVMDNPENSGN